MTLAMKPAHSGLLHIGDWRVDTRIDEISRDGVVVKLEPRSMRLLLCLAQHAPEVVSIQQLLDEVWEDVVVSPDSAYQAVAGLRRLLGDDAKEPAYIATLPRRGYRLVAAVQRMDAPATPDGATSPVHTTAAGPEAASLHAPRSPWATYRPLLLAATVLLGAIFLVRHLWTPAATPAISSAAGPDAVDKSIAVLPFVDMSEKRDQEYFADGMAEEVIDLLAKVPGIRVISRTSSFRFKAKGEDLRMVGSTLGTEYVLEGSVRKSGERLRVTAQLVRARDGSHLWSESYDEPAGDVLKVQDRIAAGLARALQVTVGADDLLAPPMLKNPAAYDLYLRGRHASDRWDRAGFESAISYFEQALELDSTAVRAAEWLALTQSNLAVWAFVAPHEGFERARRYAERALELNPRSGGAHAVLASTSAVYDWDWTTAQRESELALALEPHNPFVIGNVAFARSAFAEPEESARLMVVAISLDPLFAAWHEELGQMRYRAGRLAEAEAELQKAIALSPTYAEGYFYLTQILLAQGKLDAALAAIQRESPDNGRDAGLSMVLHAMGRRAESDAALDRQIRGHADSTAYEIAEAHAYRAEIDAAFDWLDRAFEQKDVELFWIKHDPLLKNLEPDPRYQAFLNKMKLN